MRSVVIVVLALMLAGCAQVPKPVSHTFSVQQQLAAAAHWQELASTVMNQLQLEAGTPVYVAQDDRTTFGRAFAQFLRHEALLRNYPVALSPAGATELDWGVQIIGHNGKRPPNAPFPGVGLLLAGLGVAGIEYASHNVGAWQDAWNTGLILGGVLVEGGAAASQWEIMDSTDTELLIDVVAKKDGMLRKNFLAVYYIEKADKGHYANRPVPWETPQQLPARTYGVVSK